VQRRRRPGSSADFAFFANNSLRDFLLSRQQGHEPLILYFDMGRDTSVARLTQIS
jgi:hypothetical protein